LKFSPLDIYNKEFKNSTFGYNKEQVDEFLDEVGLAYERLLKDYSSLEDEVEKLEEKLSNYENIKEQLEETLDSIQETARRQTKQARKEADNIIKEAELEAERIKQEAYEEIKEEKEKIKSLRREAREEIQSELDQIEKIRDQKEQFKRRFRTMLENYLEILEEDSEEIPDIEDLEETIIRDRGDEIEELTREMDELADETFAGPEDLEAESGEENIEQTGEADAGENKDEDEIDKEKRDGENPEHDLDETIINE